MAIIFLRFASLLLLGFATLAVLMMMLIVAAEAKENESNSDTPAGAKSLIAPKSDRSDDIARPDDATKAATTHRPPASDRRRAERQAAAGTEDRSCQGRRDHPGSADELARAEAADGRDR